MSEMEDRKRKIFDQLDHMSTEELEELLKTYSQSSEDTDMANVFLILEVIEKREKSNPSGKFTDVNAAWASFNKNYRPQSNEAVSLYDLSEGDNDMPPSASNEPSAIYTSRHGRRFIKHKAFLRFVGVLSVLIIILFSSTIVAKAFGFNLWGVVAKWTSETFGFTTEETNESPQVTDANNIKYSDMNEALAYYGIKEALVPSWVPDGYMLTEITVSESPKKVCFNAIYKKNEDAITIVINQLTDGTNGTYEKDNSRLTVYEKNDIPHYIMSNNEQNMAVWTFKNYECYITGEVSELDLKKMIESIYER